MKRVGYFILGGLCVLFLQNCSSDDEGMTGGPNTGTLILEAIVGEWMATNATFTTTNANPVLSTDVVGDGGFCDLSITFNHRFTLVIRNAGVNDPQITTGLFEADGNNINARFDTDPNTLVPWDFTISGNNLIIEGPLLYDFESDGVLEEVSANMQFVPN